MGPRYFATYGLACILIGGCSPITILNVDSVDQFGLSNYKTFNFVPATGAGAVDEKKFSDRLQILVAEIEKQLVARGLRRDEASADLMVNVGVVVEEKVQTRQTDFRNDARYMGQRNYTWQSQEVEVDRYREGTVTLHFVDRARNVMVWRGAANGVIPKKDEKVKETIALGIEELFKKVK